MVIETFGDERDLSHETECLDERVEDQLAPQRRAVELPAFERFDEVRNLVRGKRTAIYRHRLEPRPRDGKPSRGTAQPKGSAKGSMTAADAASASAHAA